MLLKQVIEVGEVLDRPGADGGDVAHLFREHGFDGVDVQAVRAGRGTTSVVRMLIPGLRGRSAGGKAPTLGVIGFLGGVGARPQVIGLVSDADGAIAALAAGLKLVDMLAAGDRLEGDVMVTTHICPHAPVIPHEPVPFMGSPVGVPILAEKLVDRRMDAVLSLDTTKGNRIINLRGFAISPTVKEGYILRVSESLLAIQQQVTGRLPAVFALATQDITPYGNGLFHLNSIMQPATVTTAPVVGVAITSEVAVPGSASGASQATDIEQAARFAVEVAKGYTSGAVSFFDPAEFRRLQQLYGRMNHLQAAGKQRRASARPR
jgi:hypothetical protein